MSQVLLDENTVSELMRRIAECLATGTVHIVGDATPDVYAHIVAGLILSAQDDPESVAALNEGEYCPLQFVWDNKSGTFDIVTAVLEADPSRRSMMSVVTSSPIAIDEGWDPLVIDVTTFRPWSLPSADREAFEFRACFDRDDDDELDEDSA